MGGVQKIYPVFPRRLIPYLIYYIKHGQLSSRIYCHSISILEELFDLNQVDVRKLGPVSVHIE